MLTVCPSFVQSIGVRTTMNNREVVTNSDLIVVAVKPHIVQPVLQEVKQVVSPDKQLFVSIAAGVTIKSMEEDLPDGTRVVRVMPNVPALVQAAASVMSPGTHAATGDSQLVQELLKTVGICEEGPEALLDAVTGVSGSGPAYVSLWLLK